MIYFDSASTYHPKSPRIPEAIFNYLEKIISSPSRGSHKQGQLANQLIEETKELLRKKFHGERNDQFHFCLNATHGLNYIIQGILDTGDHVVTTALEHNSVLRPLKKMSIERSVEISVVPSDSNGRINPLDVIKAIRPNTKLVVLNHASNVVGTILPIREILEFCSLHKITTLVDTSQTAGKVEIDLQKLPMDFMVTTGHKGLKGPSGTGVIYSRKIESLDPLIVGGSGGNSLSLWHPQNSQSIFEAGTPNYLGIAGLKAALEDSLVQSNELEEELRIIDYIQNGLKNIKNVSVHGCSSLIDRVPIISFNIKGMAPQEALSELDDGYGITLRAGLHCAPIAHQMIGTLPHGTLRLSLGHANTIDEAKFFINAVESRSAAV